jgi:hypothetical protein
MPSLTTPLKIATKGAETAAQIGAFVVGQAAHRLSGLLDRDGGRDTYVPTTPPAAPKLASVDTTAKPSTAKTTTTGPGGTARTAPAAKRATTPRPKPKAGTGGRIANPKAAKAVRKRATAATAKADAANRGAKPTTTTMKAENTPSVLAESGTGREPAPLGAKDPDAKPSS